MRTSITLVKEQQGLVSIKREKRRNISPYKTRWYDMKIALIGTKQEQSVIVSVTRRRVLVHVWTIPRYTYWARIETTGNMIPLSLCVCVCVCVCVCACVCARACVLQHHSRIHYTSPETMHLHVNSKRKCLSFL